MLQNQFIVFILLYCINLSRFRAIHIAYQFFHINVYSHSHIVLCVLLNASLILQFHMSKPTNLNIDQTEVSSESHPVNIVAIVLQIHYGNIRLSVLLSETHSIHNYLIKIFSLVFTIFISLCFIYGDGISHYTDSAFLIFSHMRLFAFDFQFFLLSFLLFFIVRRISQTL